MSFTNDNSAALLADRSWRLRHSAWMLALIFGCGFMSFIGFLYCAIRVRTKKWWIIAGITAALGAIGIVIVELSPQTPEGSESSQGSAWAGGYLVMLWIGLIVYGLIVNRDYLRWRAAQDGAGAWYRQSQGAVPANGLSSPPAGPVSGVANPGSAQTAPVLGVETTEYFAPSAPSSGTQTPLPARTSEPPEPLPLPLPLLDVNSADAASIASRLGLAEASAGRVVKARQQRGGFKTLDEIAAAAELQPHEFVKLRDGGTLGPYRPPAEQPKSAPGEPPADGARGGRILDY